MLSQTARVGEEVVDWERVAGGGAEGEVASSGVLPSAGSCLFSCLMTLRGSTQVMVTQPKPIGPSASRPVRPARELALGTCTVAVSGDSASLVQRMRQP